MNHESITFIKLFLVWGIFPAVFTNFNSTNSSGQPLDYETRFIFGGHRAHDYEFPYIFALMVNNGDNYNYACCGSILSSRFLLTAAHCIPPPKSHAKDFIVLPNYRNRAYPEKGDELYPIEKLIVHPDYEVMGKMFDIALIKLAKPLKLVKGKLFPIKMDPRKLKIGDPVQAAGWGHTNWGRPMFLEAVDLTVFEGHKCGNMYTTFDKRSMLCVGSYSAGKDTCGGDSGGPLIVRGSSSEEDRLVGLTSFGRAVCGNTPAIYSSMEHYYGWIVKNIGRA